MPPGASATLIASAATPGSATWTCSASPASTTSTGGSQATTSCVKNCRCKRCARSRIESASPSIQEEKSRDLTAVRWRRDPWGSSAAFSLRQQPVTEGLDRRPVGDHFRAYEVIRGVRLHLDVERRDEASG